MMSGDSLNDEVAVRAGTSKMGRADIDVELKVKLRFSVQCYK
jgi:hypothetical protein